MTIYINQTGKLKEVKERLSRPGFLWEEKHGEFLKYNNDEIYSPIKLTSFINVEI